MNLEEQVGQAVTPLVDQLRTDLSRRMSAIAETLRQTLDAEHSAKLALALEASRAAVQHEAQEASARLEREVSARVEREVSARVEQEVTARLMAQFETERAEAVAAAAREAGEAAERAVTERLTAEFETERLSAVAQAAADAASEAERAAIARLTADFEVQRAEAVAAAAKDASDSVEKAVTELLTAEFHAQREAAVAEARQAASEQTERDVTERLTAHHESVRATAVAEAADEARASAERIVSERLINEFLFKEAQARASGEAAETTASLRLVEAIRTLDRGQTLSDVLLALTNAASGEAARSGLFLAGAQGFQSSRLTGFEITATRLEDEDSVIAEAARSSRAVTTAEGVGAPAFANLPDGHQAIAVPLMLTGRVVGVLYADQGAGQTEAVRPSWPATIEILGRHASRVLEALTASKLAEAATGRSMKAQVSA